jgi:hypothetical protein
MPLPQRLAFRRCLTGYRSAAREEKRPAQSSQSRITQLMRPSRRVYWLPAPAPLRHHLIDSGRDCLNREDA